MAARRASSLFRPETVNPRLLGSELPFDDGRTATPIGPPGTAVWPARAAAVLTGEGLIARFPLPMTGPPTFGRPRRPKLSGPSGGVPPVAVDGRCGLVVLEELDVGTRRDELPELEEAAPAAAEFLLVEPLLPLTSADADGPANAGRCSSCRWFWLMLIWRAMLISTAALSAVSASSMATGFIMGSIEVLSTIVEAGAGAAAALLAATLLACWDAVVAVVADDAVEDTDDGGDPRLRTLEAAEDGDDVDEADAGAAVPLGRPGVGSPEVGGRAGGGPQFGARRMGLPEGVKDDGMAEPDDVAGLRGRMVDADVAGSRSSGSSGRRPSSWTLAVGESRMRADSSWPKLNAFAWICSCFLSSSVCSFCRLGRGGGGPDGGGWGGRGRRLAGGCGHSCSRIVDDDSSACCSLTLDNWSRS